MLAATYTVAVLLLPSHGVSAVATRSVAIGLASIVVFQRHTGAARRAVSAKPDASAVPTFAISGDR
jgi:hypothetical protein